MSGAISTMSMVAGARPSEDASAVSARGGPVMAGPIHGDAATLIDSRPTLGTTSYAKAMQTEAISGKVDQEAAGLIQSRDQALATLRQEHAVGIVVAVRGEIIWADIFSDTELLSRYWTKLVRSYAAESLASSTSHETANMADAQHFLDDPANGREDSEGDVGVYRYREIKTVGTDLFTLEALLPGTGYDVHVSKVKLKGPRWSTQP